MREVAVVETSQTDRKRARICLSSGDRRADLNGHSGGIRTPAVDSHLVVKWIRGGKESRAPLSLLFICMIYDVWAVSDVVILPF